MQHQPQLNLQEFYTQWKEARNSQLDELIAASKDAPTTQSLSDLVHRVVSHYEHYYAIKSTWQSENSLLKPSPPWNTYLEDAFLWIGGWRPTAVFHLLYSLSGLQLEAQLADLLRGVRSGDLGDLSSSQLSRVDKLQRDTVKEEREISEEMARLQEKMADTEMVELSRDVSESIRVTGGSGEGERDRVHSTLRPKEEGVRGVFGRADDLRLRTLKGVIEVLSPIQAVHFLIAAAQLQMRVHEWGVEKEEADESA